MEKRFDSNVATQIPKTKVVHEPHLPWNITRSDLIGSQFEDSDQITSIGKTPLGIKPLYVIVIITTIFLCVLSTFHFMTQSNERVKVQAQRAGEESILLASNLRNAINETNILKGRVIALEKNIAILDVQNKNLAEQNKDFMTVIKSMSEREEEITIYK